jgi:phage gp36-like protein
MANYATLQNLEDRNGEANVLLVADRDGDGSVDTEAVNNALSDSTEEIDSYVGVKYDLPLVSVPPILERICCDITMYRLAYDASSLTEEIRQRYDDALAWLKKLAEGKVTLGLDDEPESVSMNVQTSNINQVRLFTRTTMRGL